MFGKSVSLVYKNNQIFKPLNSNMCIITMRQKIILTRFLVGDPLRYSIEHIPIISSNY